MKYSICIVGSGSIGAIKDEKFDSKETKPKTWANAAWRHPNLDLVGIIDLNGEMAKKAALKWDTAPFTSIKEIKKHIDIYVVATSTNSHFHVLTEILNHSKLNKPGIVICEKPFCNSITDAELIIGMYKKEGVPIAVDYSRRYSLELQLLRKAIFKERYGKIYSVLLAYNRGLKHDGCHGIDFFNWFFGKCNECEILGTEKNSINDYSDNDLTVPVWFDYERCDNVFMVPLDGRRNALFELTIYTEEAKIVLDDWFQKCTIYPVIQGNNFGDYRSLSNKIETCFPIELTDNLTNLLNNAIYHIKNGEEIICKGKDALEVHRIINKLKE